MGLESEAIGEVCDRHFYGTCVGIPNREDLLPFVVDGGLEGLYLAFDGFLYCKDLMVLFYSEARDNCSEVDYADRSIIGPYCADEMMLMLSIGTEEAILVQVCVDDQFEVYRCYAS